MISIGLVVMALWVCCRNDSLCLIINGLSIGGGHFIMWCICLSLQSKMTRSTILSVSHSMVIDFLANQHCSISQNSLLICLKIPILPH